jgi:hypothetical protein
MNGSEPPSSSTAFFNAAPARCATFRPAASLPVSVTACTRGSSMTRAAWSVSMNRDRNTPRGKPACVNTSSMASAQRGTLGACLRIPQLPAMTPGAAKRKACQNGKFHGMIASTTPSGW